MRERTRACSKTVQSNIQSSALVRASFPAVVACFFVVVVYVGWLVGWLVVVDRQLVHIVHACHVHKSYIEMEARLSLGVSVLRNNHHVKSATIRRRRRTRNVFVAMGAEGGGGAFERSSARTTFGPTTRTADGVYRVFHIANVP